MLNPIFENLNLLLCLECNHSNWKQNKSALECTSCGHTYPIQDEHVITTKNYINKKKWESVNSTFSPLAGGRPSKNKLNGPRIGQLINNLKIDGITINLGSGQDNYPGHLNVDLGIYPPAHVVADLKKLPFIDESISLIVSNSVLEHIYDYNKVINEVHRILKKGAYLSLCTKCLSKAS